MWWSGNGEVENTAIAHHVKTGEHFDSMSLMVGPELLHSIVTSKVGTKDHLL